MANRFSSLMDVLTRRQFRTAILSAIGIEISQIADALETPEHDIRGLLADGCRRAACRNVQELALKMIYESEHDLFEETRLKMELAALQLAAKRMLEHIASMAATDCSAY